MKTNSPHHKLAVLVFICLCFCFSHNFNAQTSSTSFKTDNTTKKKRSFLRKLWGDHPDNGVTFMPLGLHTDFKKFSNKKTGKINGLHDALYLGVNYKSIEILGFKNSFDDPTFGILFKRKVNITPKFSFNYGFGGMIGYKGRLKNNGKIPYSDFLFSGNLNPLSGIELDYKVSKKLSIHTTIAPAIIIYGVKYRILEKATISSLFK